MGEETVEIAGAGPAGLAAAIVLARRGYQVRVFDRARAVGSRFNDDFQGIENWSTRGDCLEELRAFGIEPTWWQRPFAVTELYDAELRRTAVRAPRPLFYCVRRGAAHPDSLDNALRRQAEQAGVEVCLGRKADPAAVRIFAGGPSGRPLAVARGLTFSIDRPDLACTILSERLAPNGYIYFLVVEGRATLGTVLVGSLRDSGARLRLAVQAVERLYGIDVPAEAHAWAGVACFSVPDSCVRGRTLVVGEAAGFQDALFGFGIRSAMVSGALAAVSIAEGRDFDEAWRRRLLPFLKASQVNRAIYERVGPARQALWSVMRTAPIGGRVLRSLYGYTPLHRLASLLARLGFPSTAGR